MNFTREPLIETVITAKEGHKLAIRNSKGGTQEEFFVDSIEVISFGNSCFYRSFEKPKCFIVPIGDYEILEVRETRMILKTASVDKGIKIGGGREAATPKIISVEAKEEVVLESTDVDESDDQKGDKRRERRRPRKRRAKVDQPQIKEVEAAVTPKEVQRSEKPSLIPPPSTLISDTLGRYKEAMEEKTSSKKREGFLAEPSENSSEKNQPAQSREAIENDEEEIPF